MHKRNWLTLIASAILAAGVPGGGFAQMQGQGADSDAAKRAILARYTHNPALVPSLSRKAAPGADQGLQSYVPQLDTGAANTAEFITIDAPGASTGFYQGTYPGPINPGGDIIGSYTDANNTYHGFVRERDGGITSFDATGAGAGAYQGTYSGGINPSGTITGGFCDAQFVCHGFLRERNGTFTIFDATGAGAVPGQGEGTFGGSINPGGVIAGSYLDTNFVSHGFVRDRRGTITAFDVLVAGTGAFQGTIPVAIDPSGVITGVYYDANYVPHGFLRARGGTLITFDVPGAGDYEKASPAGISTNGEITGTYFQPLTEPYYTGNFRGFVRSRDGSSFTTFDAATYLPCCIWTFSNGINSEGATTGYYNDGHNLNYGFLRTRDGTIVTFQDPLAATGPNQGTLAYGINQSGAITGHYIDSKNVIHGFVRIP